MPDECPRFSEATRLSGFTAQVWSLQGLSFRLIHLLKEIREEEFTDGAKQGTSTVAVYYLFARKEARSATRR